MVDHLDVRVRDINVAKSFYKPFCAALGLTIEAPGEGWIGYETADPADVFLAIDSDPDFVPSRTRIALRATSTQEVDRISEAARAAGAIDFEPPQICLEYSPGYYASFFCDPDGNRFEVCHRPRAATSEQAT